MTEPRPEETIPDHRVPDILARAAEIDRDRRDSSSVEALRSVALDAGISLGSLESALEEYAREERTTAAPSEPGSKDATTGVLLSVFLGGFGAHRFYLGDRIGLIYLLFIWTLIPSLLGLVEAFWMPERVESYNRRKELIEAVRTHRLTAGEAAKREAQRRPCPYCAEMILPEAKLCRFCRSELG